MNRARGFIQVIGPGGVVQVEHETFTCSHCNGIVRIPHGAAKGETGKHCRQCHAMICPGCAKLETCTPFERKLEEIERRHRLFNALR